MLRVVAGMDVARVAEIMGRTPGSVRVLCHRGLRRLEQRLVASGKIVTSARAAWALAVGADFINTARGFMFSLGCIQALRCHQNTCPTGIATQRPDLRAKFKGTAEQIITYFTLLAEEVREILASLGMRRLTDVIGRTDLLKQVSRGAEDLDEEEPEDEEPVDPLEDFNYVGSRHHY